MVLECQGLQHIRDRYPELFEHRTMVHSMWQADLHGVARFVTNLDCLGTDPKRVRYQISSRWLEEM